MFMGDLKDVPRVLCETLEGWVARDGDGELYFHSTEPQWNASLGEWCGTGTAIFLPDGFFPEIAAGSEPVPVVFSIKPGRM